MVFVVMFTKGVLKLCCYCCLFTKRCVVTVSNGVCCHVHKGCPQVVLLRFLMVFVVMSQRVSSRCVFGF